jgi:hypothetical protein
VKLSVHLESIAAGAPKVGAKRHNKGAARTKLRPSIIISVNT